MRRQARKVTGFTAVALASLMGVPLSASAAWDGAQEVDNQASGSGAVGSYVAVADGANGEATAFFDQAGTTKGYYATRRDASASTWSAPQPTGFPSSQSVNLSDPLAAAADSGGNAASVTEQIVSGFDATYGSVWPGNAAGPGDYSLLMSTPPAQGGVTDPQVAFDSAGNGYAVAGIGQGASSDEPVLLSVYTPGNGWSSAQPISVQAPNASTNCPSLATAPKGEICGQEPRLAVSPDGSVVVVYLKTVAGQIPMTTQEQLYAVRADPGAVAGGGAGQFITERGISLNGQVPIAPYPGGSSSNYAPNFDVTIDGADTATIVEAESQSGLNNQVFAAQWAGGHVAPNDEVAISSASPPEPPASEPRVASDAAGDVSAMWTESSNPSAASLMSAELTGGTWTKPETVAPSVDNPSNPGGGSSVNTPPFSLAEDPAGSAYAVWTGAGSLLAATRSVGKNWNAADTIGGVSNAVIGTTRVASATTGQADALVVAGNGTRNAVYATRFTAPASPSGANPGTPPPGPPAVKPGEKPKPILPCNARPVARIRPGSARATRTGVSVAGTASEHSCKFADAQQHAANHVARVYVTIYRPAPLGNCSFLGRNGKLGPTVPCTKPVAFRARGTRSWSLHLRIHVPYVPGGYLVRVWAIDGFGRVSPRSTVSVVHLRVKKPKRRVS